MVVIRGVGRTENKSILHAHGRIAGGSMRIERTGAFKSKKTEYLWTKVAVQSGSIGKEFPMTEMERGGDQEETVEVRGEKKFVQKKFLGEENQRMLAKGKLFAVPLGNFRKLSTIGDKKGKP